MNYLKCQFAAITLIMSVGSISNAETVTGKNGVLGVGLDLSESFTLSINSRFLKGKSNNLSLRHGLSHGFNNNNNGFNNNGFNRTGQRVYDDYRLDLSSFAAMIDWHPGSSGFRVSAGLLHNGKESDIADNPGYLISGQGYAAYELGSLTDRVDPNNTAPYLGIGWRNNADERGGFSFSAAAGILFQGGSNSRLTSTRGLITNPGARQGVNNLEDSLDNVEIYPVLNLGISYTY